MGAVTMASTSPVMASSIARSMARPASRPALAISPPASQSPTEMKSPSNSPATRGPMNTKATARSSRDNASVALAATSGPTPRGSPRVMARRTGVSCVSVSGLLGAVFDQRTPAQIADQLFDQNVLRECRPQLGTEARVVERKLTGRPRIGHLDDRELGRARRTGQLERSDYRA